MMSEELDSILRRLRQEGPERTEPLFAALLADSPGLAAEIHRKRSIVLSELEHFELAMRARQAIIDLGVGTAGDFYFAGEYALQAGEFGHARRLFDLSIARAERSGDKYYLGSSRLLAGLACYQLNDDEGCRAYLAAVDDDVEVLWLRGFDRVTKQLVLDALSTSPPE